MLDIELGIQIKDNVHGSIGGTSNVVQQKRDKRLAVCIDLVPPYVPRILRDTFNSENMNSGPAALAIRIL